MSDSSLEFDRVIGSMELLFLVDSGISPQALLDTIHHAKANEQPVQLCVSEEVTVVFGAQEIAFGASGNQRFPHLNNDEAIRILGRLMNNNRFEENQ